MQNIEKQFTAAIELLSPRSIFYYQVMTSLSKDESENYAEAGGVAEEVLSSVRTVVAFGGQEKEVRCDRRIEPMQTIKS